MNILARFAVMCALVLPLCGFAQVSQRSEGKEDQKKFCIEQMERRTAALVARDWHQLAAEADTYIRKCGSVLGADELSRAHEHRMNAYAGMKMPKRALQSADGCLSIFYGNVGCHVGRALALMGLKRLPEAGTSLDRAERLAAVGLERLEREMRSPQHPLERELAQSRSEELKASQEFAASLRAEIELRDADE